MDRTKFYCLNYNNEQRKKDMQRRFDTLKLKCIFSPGVNFTDKRISDYSELISKKIVMLTQIQLYNLKLYNLELYYLKLYFLHIHE